MEMYLAISLSEDGGGARPPAPLWILRPLMVAVRVLGRPPITMHVNQAQKLAQMWQI